MQVKKRTRTRADGTPQVYWEATIPLGARGKRKRLTADTKRGAEKKAHDYLRNHRPGGTTPLVGTRDTVGAWVNEAVAHSTASESTRYRREMAWKRNAGDLEKLRITKLDAARVRAWGHKLGDGERYRDRQLAWETLSQACELAVVDGILPANPVHLARKWKPKRPRKPDDGDGRHRVRIYTVDEVRALKEAAKGDALPGLIPLVFDTGLRLGEALGLQWDDFIQDNDRWLLLVRRQLWEDRGQLELRAEKTTGSRRKLDVAKTTVNALGQRAAGPVLVFRSSTGGLQRKRRVYELWRRVHERAGVEADGRSPHCARHTHATALLSAGVPITQVAARLGHDSVQTTLQYYAAWAKTDDSTRSVIDRLAENE